MGKLTLSVALVLGLTALSGAHPGLANGTSVTHLHWNAFDAPAPTEEATFTAGDFVNPPNPICVTSSGDPNVNTDCEAPSPHNETAIAIDPLNPLNIVGGVGDYQIWLSAGGVQHFRHYSRPRVSFDGGRTWTTYSINYKGYTHSDDPAVAFDAAGTVYFGSLGRSVPQRGQTATYPDILVAHSNDGGRTWTKPTRVAASTGSIGNPGIFNDKDAVAAWGNGNAIVTWTRFDQGKSGAYIDSPIYASITHDGGKTWSAPTEISGSAPFCVGAQGGTACNQNQGSAPVVAADGRVYVAFLNSPGDLATDRSQYLVTEVDAQSGRRIAGPFKVSLIFDGDTDYPLNAEGRFTYEDSQFRTWALGNLASDPTTPGHLAVVWSDMRNSSLPAPADPYAATTNSDVIVSQSRDGGRTWSVPTAIAQDKDQFMPWSAYDSDGRLHVGYFDRSYDPANHRYGYTLATESTAGSLSFNTRQLTTALSDPTRDDRWFAPLTVNASFPHPTLFLGDYSAIATGQLGVAALWTDMRLPVCLGRCGFGQDAFFAAGP